MVNGDLVKLGTLYMGSTKIPRPTRPWRNDSAPYSGAATGNIQNYTAGQTLEIRNTEANDADKMQWIEVNDGGKKYLVADRVALVNISWNDLNSLGLITGKEVTIDGQQYRLRALTGGSNVRNDSYWYSGGTPTNNEWDRWIANEAGLSGLPTPNSTDLGNGPNVSQFNGAHNQKWNWMGVYSWAQETYTANAAYRAARGYSSARNWNSYTAPTRNVTIGWRPVLEVLNSGPVISGGAQNLGNKTAPFDVPYQVSDPEGDAVNIVEKLNGAVINSRTNVAQGVEHIFKITNEMWAGIPLNVASTVTIEATDSKGAKTTREYTFIKTNSAPTVNTVEPKGDLSNLAIVDTLTPVFVWAYSDIDPGDVQSGYQVIVEDLNGAVIHDSGKKTGAASYYMIPSGALQWGVRYKWTVRVFDRYDVPSDYAFHEFFLPNRPPTATNVTPGSNDADSPAGASVAPEFTWTFEDLDLEAQASFKVDIYEMDGTLRHSSSRIYQNVQRYRTPANALTQGHPYYVTVTVWDPNGLSSTTDPAYITTNATPTTPYMTGPVQNARTSSKPTFTAIIGTDAENDKQHFKIQLALDTAFTQGLLEFNSLTNRAGFKVDGFDIPEDGVDNTAQGKTVSFTPTMDLEVNKKYYWRIAAVDATTTAVGAFSAARQVRVGNKLEFAIAIPLSTGAVHARRMLIAMDYVLPTDGANPATIKVEVTNNALDVAPVWEDATAEFLTMDYYEFNNAEKTAAEFAIGFRATIHANDALGEIYVDALGITFD